MYRMQQVSLDLTISKKKAFQITLVYFNPCACFKKAKTRSRTAHHRAVSEFDFLVFVFLLCMQHFVDFPCFCCGFRFFSRISLSFIFQFQYFDLADRKINALGTMTNQITNLYIFFSLRFYRLVFGFPHADFDSVDVLGPALRESNETCVKTTILSTMAVAAAILLCILIGTLWLTCTRLHYRNKDAGLYNAYINHKGQID